MYNTYVPLFNYSVTPDTRDVYLKQFKEAKINNILLVISGFGDDPETDKTTASKLRTNIEFFKSHGIDAGVWIGTTIGHGGVLASGSDYKPTLSQYTQMVNLAGQVQNNVCCPYDKNFRDRISQHVANIATCGTKLILLDDDFRINPHSSEVCCACDLHLARFRELCGENISREDIKHLVFEQKANKYRKAWLKAQGESLELLATDIRTAVDKTAPDVRVGVCLTAGSFGLDGTEPIKLATLLAGKTKPFLRLSSAPYHSILANKTMPNVLELARMYAHFCKDGGFDIISEGDVYPRPRYNIPASILEMFDAALKIDGQHTGILKYIVDYNANPEFETSYLARHTKNLKIMDEITEMFKGKAILGVNVTGKRDVLADADLELGTGKYYPAALGGTMLAMSSIPTIYGDGGICRTVFGEDARHVDLDLIKQGCVIDGIAAKILTDRGFDVGLNSDITFVCKKAPYLTDKTENGKVFITQSDIRYAEAEISNKADTVLKLYFDDEVKPLAYTYENKNGAKFLVYLFDANKFLGNTGFYNNYLQQQVLKEGIEWISGKKLPAFIEKCPHLYIMCKGDSNKMAVALFNFFADSVDEPVIKLDKKYTNIRFINCNGKLEGDTVTLSSPIYAYTFAAFEVW